MLGKFYAKTTDPITDLKGFFEIYKDNENIFQKREPVGKEYLSKPIVIFGCSFAYGQYLNYNQTFDYKLSKLLKRPVYNRAIPGASFQHMYYQTQTEEFYKSVPPCDTVIYILIEDSIRRMTGKTFAIFDSTNPLHYKYKNKTFILDDYNNPVIRFVNSNYTLRAINTLVKNNYVNNLKNNEKLSNEAVEYFIQTKKH